VDSVDPLDPALLDAPEPPLPADELLLWCFFLPWVALPDPVVPELLELPLPAVSELVEPDPVVPPLVDPPDCAKAAPAASIEITATRFHHVLCMPNCSIHGGPRRPLAGPTWSLGQNSGTGASRAGLLLGRAREPSLGPRDRQGTGPSSRDRVAEGPAN
jgi:hypothetical protein